MSHDYLNNLNINQYQARTYKPSFYFRQFINNLPQIKSKIMERQYYINDFEQLEEQYMWAKCKGFADENISITFNQFNNPKIQVKIICNNEDCCMPLWSILQHHFPKNKYDTEKYSLSNKKCIFHQGRGLPLNNRQKEILRPYANKCPICNENDVEDGHFHHIRPYIDFKNEFKNKIFNSPINSFAYKTTTINNITNQLWICQSCHKMLTLFQKKEKSTGLKYYSNLIPELHLINAYQINGIGDIYRISHNLFEKMTKLYSSLKGDTK